MAENDFQQKLSIRRLFWQMGYYPRLNVKVTGYIEEGTNSKLVPMELTDIDVLGIRISDAFKVEYAIADCKSGKISAAARAFFLRGLMDYFGSDRSFLVIAKPVPTGTQAITSRFRITPTDPKTLAHLESAFDVAQAPSFLVDEPATRREELQTLASVTGLEEVLEYRKYYYWFYEDNRNLLNLPALAGRAAEKLSPRSNLHRYLMWDYLLLYSLSLIKTCQYVLTSDLNLTEEVAGRYFFGGTTAMRERRMMFDILRNEIYPNLNARTKSRVKLEDLSLEPPYFRSFIETVYRLLRRPQAAKDLIRYIYLMGLKQLLGERSDVVTALGEFSELTKKLAGDVSSLFVSASQIDPLWLDPKLPLDNLGAPAPRQLGKQGDVSASLQLDTTTTETAGLDRNKTSGNRPRQEQLTLDSGMVAETPSASYQGAPQPASKEVLAPEESQSGRGSQISTAPGGLERLMTLRDGLTVPGEPKRGSETPEENVPSSLPEEQPDSGEKPITNNDTVGGTPDMGPNTKDDVPSDPGGRALQEPREGLRGLKSRNDDKQTT